MLISCPACASEYEIEGVLVGAEGRSVRCAACSETWFVGPETPDPAETAEIDAWDGASFGDEPEEPAPVVIDQPMPPPRTAKRAEPKRFATIPRPSPAIAAGLALFAILPLATFGRAAVVRVMPQSAALFSAIGLPVNLRGVDFREVTAFRNTAEGSNPAQLVVEGDLVGVARERVAVSPLEIELRDARDQSLYRWTVPPSRAALEPGETARFRASLSAPPAQASQVLVRFADAGAAEASAPAGDAQHSVH
ncbi:zinc-ribbon domain-containing protein [Methylobacterium gnaphalii]|uniref:MJ0042 family finger-like domain protein n=1 Tax=Methylobacterium gnaphalii TaxID=1010610 RepID=A0A512JHZ2_9HYPH|nr:zinc-ribbon domain-containing protein [Methylobacterium gnaphalii]GEP09575.1 MJ0042 family finger-like domain protein [Methylobacterium gnaphalii]GJD67838.1 hypothetical protein MMMDOFMJ_0755 [Methylobacterium gnaphalii]GLS48127.1 MJ0042 family finger-like domain protein [Methylobacterium gnaphalii]